MLGAARSHGQMAGAAAGGTRAHQWEWRNSTAIRQWGASVCPPTAVMSGKKGLMEEDESGRWRRRAHARVIKGCGEFQQDRRIKGNQNLITSDRWEMEGLDYRRSLDLTELRSQRGGEAGALCTQKMEGVGVAPREGAEGGYFTADAAESSRPLRQRRKRGVSWTLSNLSAFSPY